MYVVRHTCDTAKKKVTATEQIDMSGTKENIKKITSFRIQHGELLSSFYTDKIPFKLYLLPINTSIQKFAPTVCSLNTAIKPLNVKEKTEKQNKKKKTKTNFNEKMQFSHQILPCTESLGGYNQHSPLSNISKNLSPKVSEQQLDSL